MWKPIALGEIRLVCDRHKIPDCVVANEGSWDEMIQVEARRVQWGAVINASGDHVGRCDDFPPVCGLRCQWLATRRRSGFADTAVTGGFRDCS